MNTGDCNIKRYHEGAKIIVGTCGCLKKDEKALVLVDKQTISVGECIGAAASHITKHVDVLISSVQSMHGIEPERSIAEAMCKADVVFCVTTFSLAHTKARKYASMSGVRFLSMPDYNLEMLGRESLRVDYRMQSCLALRIKEFLDKGTTVRVLTDKGTDLVLDISGRVANCCPGFCESPGTLGSPPDIETNIAPREDKTFGTLVVDGSIPCKEIGLVSENIQVNYVRGCIDSIDMKTKHSESLGILLNDEKKRILAEFGIGLNPKAILSGIMLEDEGCMGSVHFGHGANFTIGGQNEISFHLDFVVKYPSVMIDDIMVMKNGIIELS